MLVFMVYLASIATGLKAILLIAGVLLFFLAAIAWEEGAEITKKLSTYCVLSFSLAIFTPTEDGVYKILAAYGIVEAYEALSESEDAKRIAGKSLKYLEDVLDDKMKKEEEE